MHIISTLVATHYYKNITNGGCKWALQLEQNTMMCYLPYEVDWVSRCTLTFSNTSSVLLEIHDRKLLLQLCFQTSSLMNSAFSQQFQFQETHSSQIILSCYRKHTGSCNLVIYMYTGKGTLCSSIMP